MYEDDYDARGPRDPGRSQRGGRPPTRDDGYGPPRGGRSPRAGLWEEDVAAPRRGGRPGMGDPRGMAYGGRMDARARRGMAEEEEAKSGGLAKSLGIIVLMFVLGAGAAFGYFKLSTPKAPASSGASPTTPAASPTASPAKSATPTKTPGHALIPIGGGVYALIQQEPGGM